ncbi:ribokinase [Humibacter ginsengiterrae]
MPAPHQVAVVGSINVDLIAHAPRLPGPGETIGDASFIRMPGGKGANQAVAASRLGAATRIIGAVGDDDDGAWMLRVIGAAGVSTTDVSTTDGQTGVALIVVDAAAENQIVVCPGANSAITLDGTRFGVDEIVLTQLETPPAIVAALTTVVPGFLAVNAAPAGRLPATVIDRADLIVVNESEYQLQPELREGRSVAVTYGADGAILLEHGREVARASSPRVSPVSTVGAGDAFCAALTIALGSGMPSGQALQAACNVGSAAVTMAESQPELDLLERYIGP